MESGSTGWRDMLKERVMVGYGAVEPAFFVIACGLRLVGAR